MQERKFVVSTYQSRDVVAFRWNGKQGEYQEIDELEL